MPHTGTSIFPDLSCPALTGLPWSKWKMGIFVGLSTLTIIHLKLLPIRFTFALLLFSDG
jgi:hypothetical protein